MDKANVFDNLAKDLTEEQFEPLVNTDGVLFERIASNAHPTNRYVQAYYSLSL